MTLTDSDKKHALDELISFLKIPSVSTNLERRADVHTAAKFVMDRLRDAGADHVEIVQTSGHPIVYGQRFVGDDVPTVLVYGHYDVQPADPLDLWESVPFDPVVKEGRIYARGAADDKGQVYVHIKALEHLCRDGGLPPCNIKFLIEGEEEIGSPNLTPFIKQHKDVLAADIILVSDTSMIATTHPSITVSTRGLMYVDVTVTGPNRDLHSGVYGGAVANPINVLSGMIASLIDDKGKITIPHFYDDVRDLPQTARGILNARPFRSSEYKKSLGVEDLTGESGYTTLERVGIRPCLDICGIWGGFTDEGSKTVLPSKAHAKISCRLVPDQGPEKITQLLTEHLQKIAPRTVKVEVTPHHGGDPAVMSTTSRGYQAAEKAFAKVWGKKPIPTYEGGSLPILALLQQEVTQDVVLMGFGLDEDNIHSPNESFALEHFYKGIETSIAFFEAL